MNHRSRIPLLLSFVPLACSLPAQTPAPVRNPRLAEILRLPVLQAADWHDLFSLAESGEAEAQFWLGKVYREGRILPADQQKSVFWLQKSADQGYPRAQFQLCSELAGKDESAGERCLWHAAEDGVPEAQLWIAVFLRDGRIGVMDDTTSLRWFRKAGEGGNPDAQVELGNRYFIGDGVDADYGKAAYWYRLAAEHVPDLGGAGEGRNDLGTLYELGYGVPKDYVQALMWFSLAGTKENIAQIEQLMTADQITEAQKLAADWKRLHPDPAIY